MKRACTIGLVFLGVLGALLFLLTCVFDPIFQYILHWKMKQMLALSPDSYSMKYWETPPLPVYFQLYVFDIMNPDEVLKGAPPFVMERGPYTYRLSLQKFNITFYSNHTVSYRQRQSFVFDRKLSVGWDNDTFITVNTPLFTVATLLQYEYSWLQDVVSGLMKILGEQVLVRLSVHDIFWGYEDRFLHLVKEIFDKLHLKSKLVTGRFGFYMDRNNTDDGLYTVHTGTDTLTKFLIIDRWNGQQLLDYWSTEEANMINGTEGALYPPFVTTDRILRMYDSNIYRSVYMTYTEDGSVQGIETMKFVVEEKEFANATVNPANAGFCTPLGNCIPSGLLNCSAMGHGAPLFVSLPHFLGADPYYFGLVQGLHPNKQQHQPYFQLHKLIGVSLAAGRRYQLNVQIKEFSFLSETRGVSQAFVPVLWINGVAEIDDKITHLLQNEIEIPFKVINAVRYALFGIGPAMALCALIPLIRNWRRNKKKVLGNTTLSIQADDNTPAGEKTPLISA